jgi:hypothetical protein
MISVASVLLIALLQRRVGWDGYATIAPLSMPSPASRRTVVARGFVALVATCALSAQSGARWTTPTSAEVDAVFPDVDALYVTLHRSPELGFQEVQTAATLAARLKTLGFDVATGVGKTGIVGILKTAPVPR